LPPEHRNSAPIKLPCLPALMQLQTYAAHQVLAQEGSTDNRLYVVVDGSLAVIKQVGTPEESCC
jgi:CRP-like cAMP-binding protein